MAKNGVPVKVKAVLKIEKYPEDATEEDIKKGLVEPTEVVISEDDFTAEEETVDELFKKEE